MNKKVSEKSKLTRIVKMDDSSDDDGMGISINWFTKWISNEFFSADDHMEQLKLLASPVKEKENKTPPKNEKAAAENGKRRKAKKTISRTFKDEEGYLGESPVQFDAPLIQLCTSNLDWFFAVTKNEVVEYSCSEEENEAVAPEPSVQPTPEVQPAEVSDKSTKKKKTSPPNANSKQGSILSFFSKK